MDPSDPQARAAAIVGIVVEIHQALLWRSGFDPAHPELDSVRQLLDAAGAHQSRMAGLSGGVR